MAKLIGIAFKAKSEAPMETAEAARIEVESGLSGDYSGKLFKKRQVTVLTKEAWETACAELGESLDWTTRRANLFVEGLPSLADSKGQRLRIGGALLEITEETECSSIRTLFAAASATAPPEPPSPTITETIGAPRERHFWVQVAIASACPRSSAPRPG